MLKKSLIILFTITTTLLLAQEKVSSPKVTPEEAVILNSTATLFKTSPNDAITQLKNAISADSNLTMNFALACYFQQNNQPNNAQQEYQKVLKKDKKHHQARINLANLLINQEKFAESAKHLTWLLSRNISQEGKLWQLLGYAYLKLNHPNSAESAYRNALIFDPTNKELKNSLIHTLLIQDKYRELRSILKQELKKNPNNRELWRILTNTQISMNDNKQAMINLECMRRLKISKSADLITLADLYLYQNLPNLALQLYNQTSTLEKPPIKRLLKACEIYLSMQQNNNAKKLIINIKKIDQKLSKQQQEKISYYQAIILHATGELNDAAKAYQKLLAKDPLNSQYLIKAGELQLRLGNLINAQQHFQRASKRISPQQAIAFIRLAQIEVEKENYQEAIRLLKRSLFIKKQLFVQQYLEQVEAMQ